MFVKVEQLTTFVVKSFEWTHSLWNLNLNSQLVLITDDQVFHLWQKMFKLLTTPEENDSELELVRLSSYFFSVLCPVCLLLLFLLVVEINPFLKTKKNIIRPSFGLELRINQWSYLELLLLLLSFQFLLEKAQCQTSQRARYMSKDWKKAKITVGYHLLFPLCFRLWCLWSLVVLLLVIPTRHWRHRL